MITIKPHHFVDMIKLHGAGCEVFVPDKVHGHAFYSVGNEILNNHMVELHFTLGCDDVCKPCKSCENDMCTDGVSGLGDYTSKDSYNIMIDTEIIKYLGLDLGRTYTAQEYCKLLYEHKEVIFKVWTLETPEKVNERYRLFCAGCERYLGIQVKG